MRQTKANKAEANRRALSHTRIFPKFQCTVSSLTRFYTACLNLDIFKLQNDPYTAGDLTGTYKAS